MSVNSFEELMQHVGHNIVVETYGPDGRWKEVIPYVNHDIWNVAVECMDCYEVLIDFDRPTVEATPRNP